MMRPKCYGWRMNGYVPRSAHCVKRTRPCKKQVEALTKQLQAALVRIRELEQRKPEAPAFVKPNWPPPSVPKGPRKKRAVEHNTLPKPSR